MLILFDGTTTLTSAGAAFNNIQVTGSLTLGDALDVNGLFDVDGTLDGNAGGPYAITAAGDVDFSAATAFNNPGLLQFDGTAAQTFSPGGLSFATVQNSNTAAQVSMVGTATVDQLTIDNLAILLLDDSAATVTVSVVSGVTNNGTLTHNGTNGVTLQGTAGGVPYSGNDVSWAAGAFTLGNIDYQTGVVPGADVALSLNNACTVDSLDFSGATAATFADNGNTLTVDTGAVNFTNCTATLGGTIIFTGTTNLTSAGNTLNNFQIGTASVGGDVTAVDALDIDGTFTIGSAASTAFDISSYRLW